MKTTDFGTNGPAVAVRRAGERGHANHGWLDSHHTFSFANYYDPRFMGFRALRVINDDRVAPGAGFPSHPHRDMEIVTYVVDGAIEHKDSMGTGSVIRPGDVQRMSAGTGVVHSEFNHSKTDALRFLQIWIVPDRSGHEPGYAQQHFAESRRRDGLCLVASPDGRADSISLHQDVALYASLLSSGARATHDFAPDRFGWVQVVDGRVRIDDEVLEAGDGAAIAGMDHLVLEGVDDSELLLFDLP